MHGSDGDSLLLNRREALGVGAAGLAAAALAACGADSSGDSKGGKPRRGGVARVSYTDASTSDKLDPARLLTSFEAFAGGLLMDNLVALDLKNRPGPGLATRWEASPDGRRWTFELLKGVEFHDGRPLTSKDVAFTVERVLDPELGSAALSMFAPILKPGGIDTREAHVAVFNLERPYAFLPELLSTYFMRVLPAGSTEADLRRGIGTGPFRLKSFEPGSTLEVERNPGYWDGKLPYLDGVQASVIFEQATKLQSVLAGEAHIGDAIEYSAVPQAEGSALLLTAPGGNFGPIVLNQGNEPFEDVRVRQAFKHSIDRERLVKEVFFGQAAESADVTIPPDDPYYPTAVKPLPRDPQEARSLLRSAGFPNGLEVDLLTSEVSPGMADTAVVLKEMLAEGGINANLRKLPSGTYWEQAVGKPLACSFWLRQHVSFSLPLMFGSGANAAWNESSFSDQRVDQLIRQSQATLDTAEQKEIVAQAYDIINTDGGEIVPCHAERVWVRKPVLQGVRLDWSKVADFSRAYLAG